MFTSTYTIMGKEYTREWPDHVRAVITGTSEELYQWLLAAPDAKYKSGGKEYSAILHRMRDDLSANPEWDGCWCVGTPEHAKHLEARKTREYQVFSMLSKATKAIEQCNGWKFLQANPSCQKCGGTGYLQRYAHVSQGVCFSCFPG